MTIQEECRKEADETVNRQKRMRQVKEILKDLGAATAREVAEEMYNRHYTFNHERNNAAPRLTEMYMIGLVEIDGKKKCEYTGKNVTIYKLVETEEK